jgi:hypothetical protein
MHKHIVELADKGEKEIRHGKVLAECDGEAHNDNKMVEVKERREREEGVLDDVDEVVNEVS